MGLQQPRIGRSNELAVESVRPKGREAEATGWAASFEGYRRVLSFGVPLAHASNESPPRLTGLATSCRRCVPSLPQGATKISRLKPPTPTLLGPASFKRSVVLLLLLSRLSATVLLGK